MNIPVGFKGTALVTVGRKARPGEKYDVTTTWDAKGEPMHCVPFANKTVAEVRAMLTERGVRISRFVVPELTAGKAGGGSEQASVPDTRLVRGGFFTEPGVAVVMAHTTPLPQRVIDARNKAEGCATS
ncbi:hypothetical protein [Nonomuraea jabiensis]|uniref:hypothetical protein n=1 Tax=Nonomuraea jabiensis TaxID=882448 RepID=UPI003D75BFB7